MLVLKSYVSSNILKKIEKVYWMVDIEHVYMKKYHCLLRSKSELMVGLVLYLYRWYYNICIKPFCSSIHYHVVSYDKYQY